MGSGIRKAAAVAAMVCGMAAGVIGTSVWQQSAQAEAPRAASQRLATIDVYGLIERLIDSDKYKPAREAFINELRGKLEVMQNELEASQTALKAMDQTKPEFQTEVGKFQGRYQEFQQLQNDSNDQAEQFNTSQLVEAYHLIVGGAARIAKEKGYSNVINSRGMGVEVKANNLPGSLQEMLARPMVFSLPEDDISEAVATEMKLPAAKAPESVAPAAPTAPAAPATVPPAKE